VMQVRRRRSAPLAFEAKAFRGRPLNATKQEYGVTARSAGWGAPEKGPDHLEQGALAPIDRFGGPLQRLPRCDGPVTLCVNLHRPVHREARTSISVQTEANVRRSRRLGRSGFMQRGQNATLELWRRVRTDGFVRKWSLESMSQACAESVLSCN
jgi:hypothetical protein